MRTAVLLSISIEGADDYDKFLCNQKKSSWKGALTWIGMRLRIQSIV